MYIVPLYNIGMPLDAIVMMRFPSDVKVALKKAAKAERRSMSNLALAVLSEWLADHGHMKSSKPSKKKGS
jgi:hypothetical protein